MKVMIDGKSNRSAAETSQLENCAACRRFSLHEVVKFAPLCSAPVTLPALVIQVAFVSETITDVLAIICCPFGAHLLRTDKDLFCREPSIREFQPA